MAGPTTIILRLALLTFPREFRRRFGPEMQAAFEARSTDLRVRSGRMAAARHVIVTLLDVLGEGLAERLSSPAPDPSTSPRRGDRTVASLWSDFRHAARMLRRRPGFALVAILTLGVGLGASSAMFTLVNQVVLRPLSFADPEDLVQFYDTNADRGITSYTSAPGNFVDWREGLGDAFAEVAATNTTRFTYSGTDPAESIVALEVSANWFAALGVAPEHGRVFVRAEEARGNHRVVVVSHGFWLRFLEGDPTWVGRSIPLDGEPYTVVGVMPESFSYPDPQFQLWVPLSFDFDPRTARGVHYLNVIGRLRPGVPLSRGQAQLETAMARLRQEYPGPLEGWGAQIVDLQESMVGRARPRLMLFLGAVGLLLLIGIVNVANLTIVRAVEQSRELAIRAALGASRGRVIRQLTIESLTIAVAAAGAGILLALLILKAVVLFSSGTIPRLAGLQLEWVTVGVAVSLSLAIGIVLGMIGSARALRPGLGASLRTGVVGARAGIGRDRLRSGFVVLQIATAMVLVVGAGLLVRSLRNLMEVDPGYGARSALVATIAVPAGRYPDDAAKQRFFLALQERLSHLPGVEATAVATQLPLEGYGINFSFWVAGTDPSIAERMSGDFRVVSPGFFAAMGMPVVRGREFSSQDQPGSAPAIVISESLARQAFPDVDPVGRGLHLGYGDPDKTWTVVGVVGDVRQRTLDAEPVPGYYLPLTQVAWSSMRVVLRTGGEPRALLPAVRREVAALDPLLAIRQAETLAERFTNAAGSPRFSALLISGFALVALGLALAGIFSVMSYLVAQHTRDIGVRMALGERPGQVRWSTSRRGLGLAFAGIALGLVASVLLTRWLEGMLYGVDPVDPATLGVGTLLFVAVALAGSYWPARRASAVDPVVALRGE